MSEGIGASPVSADAGHNIRRVFASTVARLRAEQASEEAEFFERAHLVFLQDELGHEHAELEDPIASLAELLTAQGKWVAARAFLRRLLYLRVVLYGTDHAAVAEAKADLQALQMGESTMGAP